ncbi:uncharacterized protein LOC125765802 [Anopheles funestus]|uniref:uncharacterized protein LOC125765802 n=1 Tax=Anopheles funestus TaxID=62324 RepID=UPI0020C6E9D0|nr:uncharacterized protein LOC125765802 [Anopheles funestus]
MNNEKAACSIQHLPCEVLCKIFDYLDIRDVKKCSLVCQRWKETIFSDFYIKRFKFNFAISELSYKTIRVLEQSDRLYCNLDISNPSNSLMVDSARIFNVIYSIISYPKLEQLVTLKITIEGKPNNTVRMITDAIPRMKVLRELYVHNMIGWFSNSDTNVNTIKIRSNSIQLLEVHLVGPMVIKAPQLASLRILMHLRETITKEMQRRIENLLYSSRLPNLQSLEIHKANVFANINNVQHALSFLSKLETLEKLDLKYVNLSGYLFKAICENCTNLMELSIDSLYIMDTSTLRYLSNLAKLRHIQFKNIKCLERVSFGSVVLPNLESLGIGCFPMLYDTLEAFKSATKITVCGIGTSTGFIAALAAKMPKLKHVELEKFSASTIQSLNRLPNVELLTVAFDITMLKQVQSIVTTIKEIRCLKGGLPSFMDAKYLQTHFPKLQLITAGKNDKLRIKN